MSFSVIGSFTLGQINIAAAGAVTTFQPVLGQVDSLLAVTASLQGDLLAQLQGLLAGQVQISLQIANPVEAILATLRGLAGIQATLSAALSVPIPALPLFQSLGASIAVSGALSARLGGLQALIAAAINIKLPAVDFMALLAANLAVGPVVLGSFGFVGAPSTLAVTGASISGAFSAGVGGILPIDPVYGLVLVTKVPAASVALQATMRVT